METKIEAQAKMIIDLTSDLSVLMVCGSCDHCVATSYDAPFCYLDSDKYVSLQDSCDKWYSTKLNDSRNRCLTIVEPDTTKIQVVQKDGFSVGGAG